MRVVVQRVNEASVTINTDEKSAIKVGLLVLAGFEASDSNEDIQWITRKLLQMRIFNDEETKALDQFNKKIQADDRVENTLMPVRDGLMCIRKK